MAEWIQAGIETGSQWPVGLAEQAAGGLLFAPLAAADKAERDLDMQRAVRPCQAHGCAGNALYLFNGAWACSRTCLERLLRLALLEEQAQATAAELEARPRVRLGRILIEQGTINEAQLEQALRSQRATGAGRLGCWLKQQVELPEAEFTAALSIQWHCPVFRVGTFSPARMVSYLPRPLIEEHGALPLRITGEQPRLSLCFEDHVDLGLMRAVERMHGVQVDAGLLVASEFWQVTRELLGVRFPVVTTLQASSIEAMAAAMGHFLVAGAVEESRLVDVHGCYWLRVWTEPRQAPSAVPRDVLCHIRPPRAGSEEPEIAEEVESLTRQMLRVLV